MTSTEFIEKIRKEDNIIINSAIEQAFELAEFSNKNLFITGSGGVGKSVFIKSFTKHTSKSVAVVAPTGVAAINVKGQTIHKFFNFPIGIIDSTIRPSRKFLDIWASFDTLLIDEASMVRSDVFNAIDTVMKKTAKSQKPFGGKQVILVGDPFQLPPIVSKEESEAFSMFFSSRWWFNLIENSGFSIIDFNEVFRQKDRTFISILNRLRTGTHTDMDIKYLNSKFGSTPSSNAITITTTNKKADSINAINLSKIKAKEETFVGELNGNFDKSNVIAPLYLTLKVGAKVMVLRNDSSTGLVNGSIVYVTEINKKEKYVMVKRPDSDTQLKVCEATWEQYSYDVIGGKLSKVESGRYKQIPLKLAYACTAHKTQGCTFDDIILDFDRGIFESGQAYVAISRVRSIEGLHLAHPLKLGDFWVDKEVQSFFNKDNDQHGCQQRV